MKNSKYGPTGIPILAAYHDSIISRVKATKYKKSAGRPPIPKSERRVMFSVRIDPATLEWIKEAANNEDVSQGRVIDWLVESTAIFSKYAKQ